MKGEERENIGHRDDPIYLTTISKNSKSVTTLSLQGVRKQNADQMGVPMETESIGHKKLRYSNAQE